MDNHTAMIAGYAAVAIPLMAWMLCVERRLTTIKVKLENIHAQLSLLIAKLRD